MPEDRAEFLITQGRPKLIFKNNVYRLEKQYKTMYGFKAYYKCMVNRCRARITSNKDMIIKGGESHNHENRPNEVMRLKFLMEYADALRNMMIPSSQIYSELISKRTPEAIAILPTFNNVKSLGYKIRQYAKKEKLYYRKLTDKELAHIEDHQLVGLYKNKDNYSKSNQKDVDNTIEVVNESSDSIESMKDISCEPLANHNEKHDIKDPLDEVIDPSDTHSNKSNSMKSIVSMVKQLPTSNTSALLTPKDNTALQYLRDFMAEKLKTYPLETMKAVQHSIFQILTEADYRTFSSLSPLAIPSIDQQHIIPSTSGMSFAGMPHTLSSTGMTNTVSSMNMPPVSLMSIPQAISINVAPVLSTSASQAPSVNNSQSLSPETILPIVPSTLCQSNPILSVKDCIESTSICHSSEPIPTIGRNAMHSIYSQTGAFFEQPNTSIYNSSSHLSDLFEI